MSPYMFVRRQRSGAVTTHFYTELHGVTELGTEFPRKIRLCVPAVLDRGRRQAQSKCYPVQLRRVPEGSVTFRVQVPLRHWSVGQGGRRASGKMSQI